MSIKNTLFIMTTAYNTSSLSFSQAFVAIYLFKIIFMVFSMSYFFLLDIKKFVVMFQLRGVAGVECKQIVNLQQTEQKSFTTLLL